jgi:hypothetical protein
MRQEELALGLDGVCDVPPRFDVPLEKKIID